jgi:hypothetical protein
MRNSQVIGTVVGSNRTDFGTSKWIGQVHSLPNFHPKTGKTCATVTNEIVGATRQLNVNTFSGNIVWGKGVAVSYNNGQMSLSLSETGNGADITYDNGKVVSIRPVLA